MKTTATEKAAKDTSDEIRALLADAEKMLSSAGEDANGEIAKLRGRMKDALANGSSTLEQMRNRVTEVAQEKAHVADEYVRMHPYHAIGLAAGIGALAGLLVSRRS